MSDNGDNAILEEILVFLGGVATPESWIRVAVQNQSILLQDHRTLEYKAAQTALTLMGRHLARTELTAKMSRLAREELVHFEQVTRILKRRGIAIRPLSASRYASGLRALVRAKEPEKLIDILIISAFIEARSCERFAALAPYLDEELCKFYRGLLESEGRHYRDYMALAHLYGERDEVERRTGEIRMTENQLISSADEQFRFHSGVPAQREKHS